MDENLLDLALLTGLFSLIPTLDCDSGSSVYDFVFSAKSEILKVITNHAIDLLDDYSEEVLALMLNVPVYFLKLLINNNEYRGRCKICDKYITYRLNQHLSKKHELDRKTLVEYHCYLTEGSLFYMPEEFKVDEKNALEVKKTRKNKQKILKRKSYQENDILPKIDRVRKYPINPEMLNPSCSNCPVCGKILTRYTRKKHLDGHKQYDDVQCPVCDRQMKRKYLVNHMKTCGAHQVRFKL